MASFSVSNIVFRVGSPRHPSEHSDVTVVEDPKPPKTKYTNETSSEFNEQKRSSCHKSMQPSTERKTQGSSFGQSAQTRPLHSYTGGPTSTQQRLSYPGSLSQRSAITPLAEGSNPNMYTNDASTTSSDKRVSGPSGLFNTQSTHNNTNNTNNDTSHEGPNFGPTEIINLDNEYESLDRPLTPELAALFSETAQQPDSAFEKMELSNEDFMADEEFGVWLQIQQNQLEKPFFLDGYSHNGISLRPGKTVELDKGDFMQIVSIVQYNQSPDIKIRGFLFRRTHKLLGQLPLKRNEVYWEVSTNTDDDHSIEQDLVERDINEVVQLRTLKLTNRPFPDLSFREEDLPKGDDIKRTYFRRIENKGVLICRWKYASRYADSKVRSVKSPSERTLLRLSPERCKKEYRAAADILRRHWRGSTVKGGSYFGIDTGELDHHRKEYSKRLRATAYKDRRSQASRGFERNLPSSNANPAGDSYFYNKLKRQRSPSDGTSRPTKIRLTEERPRQKDYTQRYSFADGYCGAGGMTRGAVMAGLRIVWGFDVDENAVKTWALNFPYANIYQKWANEFATSEELGFKVDILHLSPPCQPWSPAHTTIGKNDEQNTASLFAITELLKKTRPRIVTVENTFGLERSHLNYMNSMILQFTSLDYSVGWKVVNLKDYGLPQSRQRLVVIASW